MALDAGEEPVPPPMAEYRRLRNALDTSHFASLRDALMGSPFVSRSTLGGSFQASRGFGVAFTAEGRGQVEAQLSALAPFLKLAIDGLAEAQLRSFWQRQRPVPQPNAWYLNLLLVGSAGGVAAHLDATLAEPAGVPGTTPRVVSVLYLKVPRCRGGELVLARENRLKGVIRPDEATLLHFRGDLQHQVRPLSSPEPGAVRASLVLEQYRFESEALARLPAFRIDSRAKFEVALHSAAQRPLPAFDVER